MASGTGRANFGRDAFKMGLPNFLGLRPTDCEIAEPAGNQTPVWKFIARFNRRRSLATMKYRLLQGDAHGKLVASSGDLDGELAAMT
ncbi:MAG: hypothetical protein ABW169_11700, partial [Sphingobium sp.]